jgi:D-alanyl-D-alanine carboxypeptidase/D-alanyl-D-alanine-endopeptidase (penicillin-binding protein 4)
MFDSANLKTPRRSGGHAKRSTGKALLVMLATALGVAAQVRPPHGRAEHTTPAAEGAGRAAARGDVQRFAARAEAQLASHGAESGSWGLLVADADTGEVLYQSNADRYFAPASNVKLFTTALALATLGPEFRIRTTIETRGALSPEGRLTGDLVLVGRGDANLSNRKFPFDKEVERDGPPEKALADLADQVVARGVRQISGDVVADDTYFSYQRFPTGWAVDDILWNSGAAVSAVAVNDNTFALELRPAAREGDPASFDAEPWAGFYTIENQIVTGARGSGVMLRVSREPGSRTIRLSGSLPLGAAPRMLTIAIEEPAEYAAALLTQLLEARGVKIFGQPRAQHAEPPAETLPARDFGTQPRAPGSPDAASVPTAPVAPDTQAPDAQSPPAARGANAVQAPATPSAAAAPTSATEVAPPTVLAEHVSLPLSEDVRLVNKISENLHAELLLRVAARQSVGAMTMEDTLPFAESWRNTAGLPAGGALLTDGSGLSREDLVTPRAVVALLEYASKQSWGELFRSTLPVAGEDGTLADRMKATPAADRIQAKTGTLEHVNALSGYATSADGAHLVFSFLSDDHAMPGHDAEAVLDAIAIAMVEEIKPSPNVKSATTPQTPKENRR